MGYVENAILPGETVKYRAKLHWNIYFAAIALLVIGIVPFVWGFVLDVKTNTGLSALVIGSVLITAAALTGINSLIKSKSSEFAVTDRRVIIKTGLISRRTLEMNASKIENISIDQTIIGRILDYGTIEISGTGGTKETFGNIAAPMAFKKAALTEAR
ncbi:MAG: PH domain-containing protein [Nitrospinae bacterium]|nr:PH domain-containing protein [Nitrospinota bacterium]